MKHIKSRRVFFVSILACLSLAGASYATVSNVHSPGVSSVSPPPQKTYSLTVALAGNGEGSLAGSGAFTGSGSYPAGTSFSLTATASKGSTFTGWSGACSGTGACVVTLNSNQSVTATFTKIVPPSLSGLKLSHFSLYLCGPNGKNCHQRTIKASYKYVGPAGILRLRVFRNGRLVFTSRLPVTASGYIVVPRRYVLAHGTYTVKAEVFAGSQHTSLLTETIHVP
jgi:hypothetical protein